MVNKHAEANAAFCLWETSLCIRACLTLGYLRPVVGQGLLPSCGKPGGTAVGSQGSPMVVVGRAPTVAGLGITLHGFRSGPSGVVLASSRTFKSQFVLHWSLCLQQLEWEMCLCCVKQPEARAAGVSCHPLLLIQCSDPTGTAHLDVRWMDISFQGCSPY